MGASPVRQDSLGVEVWESVVQRAQSAVLIAVLHTHRTHKHSHSTFKEEGRRRWQGRRRGSVVTSHTHRFAGQVGSPVLPGRPWPDACHVVEGQALRGQLRQALPGGGGRQRRGVGRHGGGRRRAGVVAQTWRREDVIRQREQSWTALPFRHLHNTEEQNEVVNTERRRGLNLLSLVETGRIRRVLELRFLMAMVSWGRKQDTLWTPRG